MIALITTHTAGVDWDAVGAIGGPLLAAIGAAMRLIARKIDAVGRHLTRQDKAKHELALRIGRIEEWLKMPPMVLNGDDPPAS